VRDLIAGTESDAMHLQLYRNDEYYCEERNRFSDLYAALALIEPVIVPSLREAFAYSAATKAVIVADADAAQKYAAKLSDRLNGSAYVTRSLPEFVEVLDPAVDKGKALRFVAWNDAPLLDAAGFGVAMGSAPAELRERADAVVGDLAHDGVAEAIEKYVLA
jgi:hydroxymethylpyrimidine pyrophosphatase-like HAD family hydrolase